MRPLLSLLWFTLPLLAAPVPEVEEKPKPRAKLLGTLTLDSSATSAFWLADGKHFVLATRDRVTVYARDSLGKESVKPLATLARTDDGIAEIGLTPDGDLYILTPPGGRMNAENQIRVWLVKTLLVGGEPKPDRILDLEVDNLDGLVFSADGKSLYGRTVARGPKVKGSPIRFVRLSAKTGDVQNNVPLSQLSDDYYIGHCFDARTGRLYLATVDANREQAFVQCRESDGGKQVWSAVLPGQPHPQGSSIPTTLTPSLNGERIVVAHSTRMAQAVRDPQIEPPGARRPLSFDLGRAVTVLDVAKGEMIADASLESQVEARRPSVPSVSSDGRLMFAVANHRAAVTDTKAGVELKGWELSGWWGAGALAAFQPGGYELLLVEREVRDASAARRGDPGAVPPASDRAEPKTIVGVWGFSQVVK